eukprot:Filipodium_phascolosomae@DN1829_c0_g1_i3.p1
MYALNHVQPEAFTRLYKLQLLEEVDLCGCLVEDSQLENAIPQWQALKRLNLSWCVSVSDCTVVALARNCKKIKWLSLHGLKLVTDRSVEAILANLELKNLMQSLDVQGCSISPYWRADGFQALRDALPELTDVYLHH